MDERELNELVEYLSAQMRSAGLEDVADAAVAEVAVEGLAPYRAADLLLEQLAVALRLESTEAVDGALASLRDVAAPSPHNAMRREQIAAIELVLGEDDREQVIDLREFQTPGLLPLAHAVESLRETLREDWG